MKDICRHVDCTGCQACRNICAHQAIINTKDSLGFFYPKIDDRKCIDCGLCQRVCPSINPASTNPTDQAIAGIWENEDKVRTCSSGGLATLISQYIISQGGIVYGCDGRDIKNVHHIRVSDIFELDSLKGSKYIQSSIDSAYSTIKKDLIDGKTVLFIGIPCQVAGVRKYLMKEYSNFYCIDILCHGASSQDILTSGINSYCKRYRNKNIENVRFRKKESQPDGRIKITYGLYFNIGKKEYAFPEEKDPFCYGYANNLLFRDSCYECHYSSLERVSDLTLGDFWGLKNDCGKYGKHGISLILPHNDKGRQLLAAIKANATLEEQPLADAISGNPQLVKPTGESPNRDVFIDLFPKLGLRKSINKIYGRQLRNVAIMKFIKRFIGSGLTGRIHRYVSDKH